jgi:hypothetical protein
VVQLDARGLGDLEAVLGVDRRVVLVEDVDATAVEVVRLDAVAEAVIAPLLPTADVSRTSLPAATPANVGSTAESGR